MDKGYSFSLFTACVLYVVVDRLLTCIRTIHIVCINSQGSDHF